MIDIILLASAFVSMPQNIDHHLCSINAVWYEARGESDMGKRAVLDVIRNRGAKSNKNACDVVSKKGQFSFYSPNNHRMLYHVNIDKLSVYYSTLSHKRVLGDNFIFFSRGYQYGAGCKKIGNHLFCQA